jgi:hypothetical protein
MKPKLTVAATIGLLILAVILGSCSTNLCPGYSGGRMKGERMYVRATDPSGSRIHYLR